MSNRSRQSMIQRLIYENGITIFAEFRLVGEKRISDFCIQFETRKGEPIIRYDCKKHGFHRNLIYNDGKKEPPYPIQATTLEDFAIKSIEDLRVNLKQLLEKAGYQIEPLSSVYSTLEKQKEFLIKLINDPSNIVDKKRATQIHITSKARIVKRGKT
jgi:hypothetical protein